MKVVFLLFALQPSACWFIFGNFFHNRSIRNARLQVSDTGVVTGTEHLVDGPYGKAYYEVLKNWKSRSLWTQMHWWKHVQPKAGKYIKMWGDWICPYEPKAFSAMYAEWRADPSTWVWIPESKYKCITLKEAREKMMQYKYKIAPQKSVRGHLRRRKFYL